MCFMFVFVILIRPDKETWKRALQTIFSQLAASNPRPKILVS